MAREKRRHRREEILAEVYYQDEKNLSAGGCVAKDVSESGVRLKIIAFFPVGTVLDLQFKLPLSEEVFYVKGKIMWVKKMPYNEEWEVGLEVLDNQIYLKLVQRYIFIKDSAREQNPPSDQNQMI